MTVPVSGAYSGSSHGWSTTTGDKAPKHAASAARSAAAYFMDSARSGSKHSFGMDWRSSRSDGTGPTVVTPAGPRPSVGAEMALGTRVDAARAGLVPGLGDAEAVTRRDARRVVAIDVAARDEGTEAEMPNIAVIIFSATNAAGDTRRVSSRM